MVCPYRDLFLHHRYLSAADCPQLEGCEIDSLCSAWTNRQRLARNAKQLVAAFQKRSPRQTATIPREELSAILRCDS